MRRPEDVGLQPDRLADGTAAPLVEPRWSRAQAMRTPAFWLLSLYTVLLFPVQAGVSLHNAPHLIERGLSPVAAASAQPVPQETLAPRPTPDFHRATTAILPSRAADNLFWLGRYVERTEMVVRLLRARHIRLAENGHAALPLLASVHDILASYAIDELSQVAAGLRGGVSRFKV